MNNVTGIVNERKISRKDLKQLIESKEGLRKLLESFSQQPALNAGLVPDIESGTNTVLTERPGQFLSSIPLTLPYDSGTPLEATGIRTIHDEHSPFAGILAQSDLVNGELNLAVLMGKWFYWNYNPLHLDVTTVITNIAKAEMFKTIRFNPFNKDVFAIAKISGTIPSNHFVSMFTGWAEANILLAGIQADFSSSLSYFDGVNYVNAPTPTKTLIRSVKVADNLETGYVFEPTVEYSCLLRIPAHLSEIAFQAQLLGQAFTSSDVNALLTNNNINQYALAMLDLRNVDLHRNTPIIMNPLSGDIWHPSGGLKLNVKIEFYDIDSTLAH